MALHYLTAVRHLGKRALTAQRCMPSIAPMLSAMPVVTGRNTSIRSISSTEKKPSTHVGAAPQTVIDNPPRTPEDFIEVVQKPRNWISYGYSTESLEEDRDQNALVLFCMISIGFVFTSFVVAYLPDYKSKDWTHREAYLELARREKHGLPLIDKEFIPLERIQLPTEKELEGKKVYL